MEIFDFQDLINDPILFNNKFMEYKSLIKNNFGDRHQKQKVKINGKLIEMTHGQILLNLFLLSLFKGQKVVISENDLFLKDSISGGDIESYLNNVLERIKKENLDFNIYRESVYDFLNKASKLGLKANVLAGNTLDFLDFVEISANDPESENLFKAPNLENLQYNEIEALHAKKGDELIKYFNNHRNTNLSIYTRSGTGINKKQLTQTLGFVGLKPDFKNGVIPKPVTCNFLIGLDNIEDYYISATGARLALSTNYSYVRKSGYFTRKLNLLMTDIWHDNDYVDCGTKYFVRYEVSNKKKLAMINGRHYYILKDDDTVDYNDLRTVNSDDIGLIGQTIALRSPTCCLGNQSGMHICRTCYGKALSEINKNMHTGIIAVDVITNVLTQTLLSAKHLLTTKTDKVEWGNEFADAFVVNMDSIYFNDDASVELILNYPNDEDYDEDTDSYSLTEFDIHFSDDKKPIHYVSPTPLYIKRELVPKRTEENIESFKISSETFDDSEIFKYVPHNNALSRSLENILDLIESGNHLGVKTYDELVNKFADLLIENNMSDINSVHPEMICSRLIVNENGKPLDWSKKVLDPYKINRVSKSVINSPISTSLSFERLGNQLSNLDTYLKEEPSIMDCLFD